MENPSAIEQARQLFARSWAAYSQGDLKEAEESILQAKAIWEQEMGPESLPVSTCMNNLGRICEETDRAEEGIEWHRKALALRKKLLGVEELHFYDIYTPLIPDVDKKIPFARRSL